MARKPAPTSRARRTTTTPRKKRSDAGKWRPTVAYVGQLQGELDATNAQLRDSEIRNREVGAALRRAVEERDRWQAEARRHAADADHHQEKRNEAVVALQAISDLARHSGDSQRGRSVNAPHLRDDLAPRPVAAPPPLEQRGMSPDVRQETVWYADADHTKGGTIRH